MMHTLNERLKALIADRTMSPGGSLTEITGLTITRCDDLTNTDVSFQGPTIELIVQGVKEVRLGVAKRRYGELSCIVNGGELPTIDRIVDASPETPFLAVTLAPDKGLVTELAAEIFTAKVSGEAPAVSIAPVTREVLQAFTRLIGLLDRPAHLPLRAPIIVREIVARVLSGHQGKSFRLIANHAAENNDVANAVAWLHRNYLRPFSLNHLTALTGLPTTTFYRRFKRMTSLTPLQYQKRLRLHEAQRLMLNEDMDANSAARAVGYDLAQHFNRDYKRLFGEPPFRHIRILRSAPWPERSKASSNYQGISR